MILSPAPALLPQASITKASLTETQAMLSTPLLLISSAFSMKPGRCLRLQVGVKAPGTANRMTFLPAAYICRRGWGWKGGSQADKTLGIQ